MPTYCYSDENGDIYERFFHMGKAPKNIEVAKGNIARRDFAAEHMPRKAGKGGWPLACVASGVHPSQAQELRDFFKANGENCEVNHEGDPVYTSPTQRKRCLRLRGLYDKNSFD